MDTTRPPEPPTGPAGGMPPPAGPVELPGERVPIRAWIQGVEVDEKALAQLRNVSSLPFVHRWIAVMPDCHWGLGATIGSVIPTCGAIVPAAVGVDLGCGMMAVETSLRAEDLPEDLKDLRRRLEKAVPHGRTHHGGRNDRGAWGSPPARVEQAWKKLRRRYELLCDRFPGIRRERAPYQLGTLGTGNHFLEVCLDERGRVWVMLHSGSRGPGNRIGTWFIEQAKRRLEDRLATLPDRDLAWLEEGDPLFEGYVEAVDWAQTYARVNRELMMEAALEALRRSPELPPFRRGGTAVNCHHNYVQKERHFGEEVWVTRKGAVRAGRDELGIIPGSMGARSYIVRGLGNPESFCSCSHGAGRLLSRSEARRRFRLEDHVRATEGVECRKDEGVLDETPMAYKDIDRVMAAQRDLVEPVHTLRQVICVKG